ncbi:hypothetical protein [Burkholderia cenocepacia]|uniref:hypothetical protein n=1 Tax=Burkholderia cenocepacia TaxID=95486 RepID=UPI001177F01B|nr:hypothetical protein [Burkholderia cenocepacia]MCW5156380.1 hypothetical protein [Burkholderia cenocepacia]
MALGINQKTVLLFDEVFIKGKLHDQIHYFGDYGIFFTYRNVPNFIENKISVVAHITIEQNIQYTKPSITFFSYISDFSKPLEYMNRHDKSFREAFISYANKITLGNRLPVKDDKSTTKRNKI